MKRQNTLWTQLIGVLAFTAAATFLAGSAWAQQKTVEEHPAGPHEVEVQLNHSAVVYVEGNHIVVRLEDGRLEALMIPENFRFHHDGETLSVHQLKPGMKLTETVTTTTKPMMVRTVEIHNGTIWNAAGEHVTIHDQEGKMHRFRIPAWAKVDIDGEERTVYELQRGMKIDATIITEEPLTVVEREAKTRVHPPAEAPNVPATRPRPRRETQGMAEPTTPPMRTESQPMRTELPATASPLPLVGLLGLLSLAASFGLRMMRKPF